MSKKCVICGIELDETTPVCPKCGTRNSEKSAEPTPAVISETPVGPTRCVICGIMLDETMSVCPKCGSRNPAAASQPAPSEPEPPQRIVEPVLPETSDTPTLPETPVQKKPAPKKRHRRKLNPRFLVLCGIVLALIAGIVLLVSLLGSTPGTPETPTDPPSAFSTLLDGQLALLSGNPEDLERLAPEEYWEYCSYKNNCTKEEYLIRAQNNYLLNYKLNYPKGGTTYTGEVLFEDAMSADMLQKVTDALFVQYGIFENSITDGKELTIQVKKVTDGNATVLPGQTAYAVEINDTWYIVSYTELPGESIVTFFLR